MSVRRVVPDITSEALDESRDFYQRLGLVEVMNLGWVMTLASPSNPAVQLTLMGRDASAAVQPHITVEVDDVDAVHAAMAESGAEIVHALRDEPWGVRRFFVRDPNGQVVNVVGHQ